MALKVGAGQPSTVAKVEPKTYLVQKVIGGDTYLVMAHSQIVLEDEFANLYFSSDHDGQVRLFLQPPFDPKVLLSLVQTNNTLNQCVEAMEVNIDGTGHEFVPVKAGGKMDDSELAIAESFFKEVFPGTTFRSLRRHMRRERESVGYSYFEVVRNPVGDIMGLRPVYASQLRMIKLDDPVQVEETIERAGKDVKMTVWKRQRRFGQRVANITMVFYKEFGVQRKLSRSTGRWESKDYKVAPEDEATELVMSGIVPDVRSPYFVPRWINNLPSVVGSRKAEEQNLQFFDAGGMPPAIIFIQGGTLASDAADQLRLYLSGANKNKHRAVVVEAQSSSGSLESAGSVQVKVERFGGEKQNDALYEKYDLSSADHVRTAFRLPPLFLGKAQDYNFATALTAYMTAEAQVFKPERDEFDDLINNTIIKALGLKTLKIKSKPITLQDVANQLVALGIVKDAVDPESLVKSVNDITGLNLEAAKQPAPGATLPDGSVVGPDGHPVKGPMSEEDKAAHTAQLALQHSQAAMNDAKAGLKPGTSASLVMTQLPKIPGVKTPGTPPTRKTAFELIGLAKAKAIADGLLEGRELSAERLTVLKSEQEQLHPDDLRAMMEIYASYAFNQSTVDMVDIACAHQH